MGVYTISKDNAFGLPSVKFCRGIVPQAALEPERVNGELTDDSTLNETQVITKNSYFADLANAIREKNKTDTKYCVKDMAAAIRALKVDNKPVEKAARTVLYTDGTFVMNELGSKSAENEAKHGVVVKTYPTIEEDSNHYVYTDVESRPWHKWVEQIKRVEIGSPMQPTSTANWFNSTGNMEFGDFTLLDTSKVTQMEYMFRESGSIYGSGEGVQSYSLIGLDTWDTSNVTNMFQMFYHTGNESTEWSIGDLSNWDTSQVINMSQMFYFAGQNAIAKWTVGNLDNWDITNVIDMSDMFCQAGEQAKEWYIGDLSQWKTGNVTNMAGMFMDTGCNALIWDIGNLSNWDTTNVTSTSHMFYNAGSKVTAFALKGLSTWNTSKITTMKAMFSGAGKNATTWSLGDLSQWDTSKVKNMNYMFDSAGYSATDWSVGDLRNWDVVAVGSNHEDAFYRHEDYPYQPVWKA